MLCHDGKSFKPCYLPPPFYIRLAKKCKRSPIEFPECTAINKITKWSVSKVITNRSRFIQEQAKHLCLLKEFEFGSQSILVAATYSVCILQSPHISFYGRHKRGTVSFLWSDQLKNPQIRTQHSSLLRACGLVLMPYFAIFTLSHFRFTQFN